MLHKLIIDNIIKLRKVFIKGLFKKSIYRWVQVKVKPRRKLPN